MQPKLTAQTRHRTVLLVLLIGAVILIGALSTVWLQQQMTRSAESGRELEAKLAETVRKIRTLDERIATLHQPVTLQSRINGKLRPSMENQVVWVRERALPGERAYAVSEPYEVSMDLAFIDLDPPRGPDIP